MITAAKCHHTQCYHITFHLDTELDLELNEVQQ